ncbi:right-handed parallel beta-helix repeat-containing protein [Pseudalkalibacillus caeni]|uniref:Periplasmic copper-binding protein NosD beta helix domain-containing protein n=1 Tax=Exobacillus caeni TaxID=2574798 RepID=A0A5R9F998_9BACL|nr:right-handed parallel beta-helix repeat-containing protein [Pseudalkalibacillus caeni]TLS37124.1 hypothetical protein FCL54_11390 [Pseudalkalibacillus caeni]
MNTSEIQRMMDMGGFVEIPEGVHELESPLLLRTSGLYLRVNPRAILVRKGRFANLLKTSEEATGYNGVCDVTIEGGVWHHNGSEIDASGTAINFGHCTNITIRNIIVLDVHRNHAVEANSSKKVRLLNCMFDGQVGEPRKSEAFQIDGAFRPSVFPHHGIYDYTSCKDVLVEGCQFINWSRGIGSHSYEKGHEHKDIKIIGNHFETIYDEGVRALGYNGLIITGNTFYNCSTGIKVEHSEVCSISSNTIQNSAQNGISLYNDNEQITVNGNNMRNCGGQGISLYNNSNNTSIVGNTIQDFGQYGIVINASHYNMIDGNIINSYKSKGKKNAGIRITKWSSNNTIGINQVKGISPPLSFSSTAYKNEVIHDD